MGEAIYGIVIVGIKVAQLNVHELQLRMSLMVPECRYSQLIPGWAKVTFEGPLLNGAGHSYRFMGSSKSVQINGILYRKPQTACLKYCSSTIS